MSKKTETDGRTAVVSETESNRTAAVPHSVGSRSVANTRCGGEKQKKKTKKNSKNLIEIFSRVFSYSSRADVGAKCLGAFLTRVFGGRHAVAVVSSATATTVRSRRNDLQHR